MDSRSDRREEIYLPRDTGYGTSADGGTFESLPARPRRTLSPILWESLTPAGRNVILPSPTRRSPDELQMEIDAVQHKIDELATSVKRPRRARGLDVPVSYTHLTLPTILRV